MHSDAGSGYQAAAARSSDVGQRRCSSAYNTPCGAAAVVHPTSTSPDTTVSRKREDSVCCLSMHHDKSHLHGGCLVNSVSVKSATAGLNTTMATLWTVAWVFETVPEVRDRLAVIPVTLTNPEHSMAGRRSTTRFVVGTPF